MAKVVVIGGANVDIYGKTYEDVRLKTSNPGTIKTGLGGVGRNIAENLSLVGIQTTLITAVGDDIYGKTILEGCKNSGIDIDNMVISQTKNTGVYMSIVEPRGDMAMALSSMDIMEELTPEVLEMKRDVILDSDIIVMDTNLTKESLEYITSIAHDKGIPVFLDTVSLEKSKKIKDMLHSFDTIKPNLIESREISGVTEGGARDIGMHLLLRGVKNIVISLGENGCYYRNKAGDGFLEGLNKSPVNTIGCGDGFMAGLVYGRLMGWGLDRSCSFASRWSAVIASEEGAVKQGVKDELLLV